ncbi:MAG: hypothetical protein ACKPKG_20845, partial [Dolichospermum sp.]
EQGTGKRFSATLLFVTYVGFFSVHLLIICSMNVEIDSCKYLCHIISIGINHQIHEYRTQLCPDADI